MLRISQSAEIADSTKAGRDTFVGLNVALSVALILIGIIISSFYYRFSNDDPYITYRYSYNLAHGNGFVFNVGERYLGTSTPLYGLLLGFTGSLGIDIPLFSGMVSSISLILSSLALFAFGRQMQCTRVGWLAAFFWIINPFLGITFGLEMLFQTMLIAWSFVFYFVDKTYIAALLISLAILTRGDSVSAGIAMGVHSIFIRRRFLWREAVLIVSILLPFLLLSKAYYDQFLPGTLGAKAAQTASGIWPSFVIGILHYFKYGGIKDEYTIICGLLSIGGIIFLLFHLLLAGEQADQLTGASMVNWLLPLSWGLLFIALYSLLHIPYYSWYMTPFFFAYAILAAIGAEAAMIAYSKFKEKRNYSTYLDKGIRWTLATALVVFALTQIQRGWRARNTTDPRRVTYLAAINWLDTHASSNASLGFSEVGYIGYFSKYRIVDGMGLVTPAVYPHIAKREFVWAYQHYQPDFILSTPSFEQWNGVLVTNSWINCNYHRIAIISRNGSLSVSIYQKNKSVIK